MLFWGFEAFILAHYIIHWPWILLLLHLLDEGDEPVCGRITAAVGNASA